MKRILVLLVVLSAPLALGALETQPSGDAAWRVVPCESFGPVRPQVTKEELIRLFGVANLQDLQIEGPEGENYPGTVVFPNDPLKRFKIIWQDINGKRHAADIAVEGPKSLWKTPQGIALGMTLKELEKLNGGSFTMSGYEWDYGGRLLSWGTGTFSKSLPKKLSLQFDYNPGPALTKAQLDAISGDRSLSSSHPALQALNPKVAQISCTWQ